MSTPRGKRLRAVPQRTCLGCRRPADKRALIRVVRTPDGRVRVDETGKANGRGAYLHASRECWEKGLKGGTMKHALHTSLAPGDLEALKAFGLRLPEEGVESR